ncbi:SpoIIE family protein phosphatase [Streptomyces sp. YC504]|uniref:SpoIIE family protein phosphatase n=1 Tax=Streptomyces mesophilus TaxID=1775132 RepID=A0A6G4XDU0_9ACTN|nr:SpoIIE family protein phosphatase [Streptomyces mesophilus]NGO75726.1 SpoIIE family protein phosphatase [Streptomyces mesophilus]
MNSSTHNVAQVAPGRARLLLTRQDGGDGTFVVADACATACAWLGRPRSVLRGADFMAFVGDASRLMTERMLEEAWRGTGDGVGVPANRQPVELELEPAEPVVCMLSVHRAPQARDALLVEIEDGARLRHWAVLRALAVLSEDALWAYDEEADLFGWLDGEHFHGNVSTDESIPLVQLLDQLHPEDRPRVEKAFWDLREDRCKQVTVDYRMTGRDGHYHWLRTRSRVMRFGFGQRRWIIGSTNDTTATVERHQALTEAHALARRRGELVEHLAAEFVSATTEHELTAAILDHVAPAFGGEGTLVAFVEEGRLRVTFGAGIAPALARNLHGVPLNAPKPLTQAIVSGRPEFIVDRAHYRQQWPHAHDFLSATRAESFVMVPLLAASHQLLGGWVITFAEPHHPSEQERTLVRVIATLAGQAWERIRLQAARLELAGALQRDMLPRSLPEVAGYEIEARYASAHTELDVGGDWFDVIALPHGGAACIIGDVQGHSIKAAALMGQVRTAMHAYAWEDPAPQRVLERTNALMQQMGARGFATCLYLLIEPDGRIVASRAGHVPFVQAGRMRSEIREIPGGLPLGIFDDASYPITEFTLPTGGTLALVTDGLVEGPSRPLDEGLRLVARAATDHTRPLSTLADEIMALADATGHTDDCAALVIRRS